VLVFTLGLSVLTYLRHLRSYVLDRDDISATIDAIGAIASANNSMQSQSRNSDEGALLHKFDVIKNQLYRRASRHTDTSGTNQMVQPTEELSSAKRNESKRDKVRRRDYTSLEDLYSSANSVFEYGIGVSTKIASKLGVPRYSGIDSDAEAVVNLRKDVNAEYFRFNYAKLEDTYDYQAAPLVLEEKPFEIYLVNVNRVGKHWVACLCASFLHAIKYNSNMTDVQVVVYGDEASANDKSESLHLLNRVIIEKGINIYTMKEGFTTEKDIFQIWINDADHTIILSANEEIEESKFDSLVKILYNAASAPATVTRNAFDVVQWRDTTTGGLDATDRKLLGLVYSSVESVFEYGLGESSYIAAHAGVPRYSGTDSDSKWISMVQRKTLKHFRFFFADIGETKEWGSPVKAGLKKNQFDYQIAPLLLEQKPFDFYLVDGRYRTACFCISFLHAMKHGANMENVMVGVHDNDRRPKYHERHSQVADMVLNSKRLWVYKLREGVTEEQLYDLWLKFTRNPS